MPARARALELAAKQASGLGFWLPVETLTATCVSLLHRASKQEQQANAQ